MSVLRFFACALMVMAFVPHHHADDASGRIDKPCSLCVSMQNSSASLAAERPSVTPLAISALAPFDSIEAPADVACLLPSNPRAPPF